MKTRIFLVAAALLMLASMSFGQGFLATFYSADPNGNAVPLSITCGGTDYLPNGAMIQIFWDQDGNGPSDNDVQPPVGNDAGMVNYNAFPIDGSLGPGTFATDPSFVSVGILPANPRYYFREYCGNGLVHYVSAVYTLVSGPQDVFVYQWTCTPCVETCNATQQVLFYRDPVPNYFCAHLCAGVQTLLRVCPNPGTGPLDPTKTPIVAILPGCDGNGCSEACTPGSFVYNAAGWVYDAATGCFVNVVTGTTDNTCVCVQLNGFLAAGVESFTGMAGDNEVRLTWQTGSEAGISSFAVVRNGDVVAHMDATNPNGATYNYVDKGVHNGTTYTYTLRTIDANGNASETGYTVNTTPSFSAAVVTEYALLQNYPNPFNPTTQIAFDVLNSNPVTLKVFNANGQVVATLINGATYEGGKRYMVNFDATNLTSGLYFYTVKIGNEFSATKKMMLIK